MACSEIKKIVNEVCEAMKNKIAPCSDPGQMRICLVTL